MTGGNKYINKSGLFNNLKVLFPLWETSSNFQEIREVLIFTQHDLEPEFI